jgi:anti-anti-sigma factor
MVLSEQTRWSKARAGIGAVEIDHLDGETLIRLSGEVDLAMGKVLGEVASEAAARAAPIRIDAAQLTFIDSTGLNFLARLAAPAVERGEPVVICAARRAVLETIELAGMTKLFTVDTG